MSTFRVTEDDGARLRDHLREPRASAAAPPDIAAGLGRLCEAALPELDLVTATVVLVSGRESATVAAAAGSPGARVEILQFDLGEGPTHDVSSSGRPVLQGDLGAAAARWPGFAPAAAAEGVGGAFAFPLALGALRFGALGLYTGDVRRLRGPELAAHLLFADVATELLVDGARAVPGTAPGSQLDFLTVRSEVYQAQGMVMVDLGVSLSEALARMRAHAFAEGLHLNELAIAIVQGRRLPTGDAQ